MSEHVWLNITEYRGKSVPLEITAKIKEQEGIFDDEVWDRRGVEVGDDAWAILDDWFFGQVAVSFRLYSEALV